MPVSMSVNFQKSGLWTFPNKFQIQHKKGLKGKGVIRKGKNILDNAKATCFLTMVQE